MATKHSADLSALTGDWRTNIQDWTKIKENTAKLMLDQCETALKETADTAKSITEKSEKILTILLPITTAVLAYLFSRTPADLRNFIFLTAICALPVLLASIFFAYKNFVKYEVFIPGDFPSRIVQSVFIDNEYTADQQYVNLVLNICENIQRKIDINERTSKARSHHNVLAIRVLGLIILAPAAAFLISLFLPQLHS
jgi:hypothetical protein